MEFGIQIVELCIVRLAVLPSAQTPKVLRCLGREIIKQLKHYSPRTRRANLHIHINLIVCLGAHALFLLTLKFIIDRLIVILG